MRDSDRPKSEGGKVVTFLRRVVSFLCKVTALLGAILSFVYLLNPTFGIDLLPDNLFLVGNIDEATATGILLACLRYLGLDLLGFIPGRGQPEGSAEDL